VLLIVKQTRSEPKNCFMVSATAPLKQPWAARCSGWFEVDRLIQSGSGAVSGLPSGAGPNGGHGRQKLRVFGVPAGNQRISRCGGQRQSRALSAAPKLRDGQGAAPRAIPLQDRVVAPEPGDIGLF
jgi:hypothetical protein